MDPPSHTQTPARPSPRSLSAHSARSSHHHAHTVTENDMMQENQQHAQQSQQHMQLQQQQRAQSQQQQLQQQQHSMHHPYSQRRPMQSDLRPPSSAPMQSPKRQFHPQKMNPFTPRDLNAPNTTARNYSTAMSTPINLTPNNKRIKRTPRSSLFLGLYK
jgi:hypothetical protein